MARYLGHETGPKGWLLILSIVACLAAYLWIVHPWQTPAPPAATVTRRAMATATRRPTATRLPTSTPKQESDFVFAFQGDYWIIWDRAIAVLEVPELPGNEAQLRRNLVTILEPGQKVEVLQRQGFLSPWLRVFVYDKGRIIAEGWILAETVREAERVQQEEP